MIGSLLDVLFPRRCAGCGRGSWPFCARCRATMALLLPPGCRRCGRPLERSVASCRDCPPEGLSWARSGMAYRGAAKRALQRLKFGQLRSVAPALGPAMVDALARSPPPEWALLFDVVALATGSMALPTVTWVPLGRRRRRRRGFDQAEALARQVAVLLDWPIAPLLERTAETAPQARRSGVARREAVLRSFRPVGPAPRLVLLVDDVLTTGWTAAACALALREAGAREVGVLTAARSLGGPLPARCYNPAGLSGGSVVARGRYLR